MKHKNIEKVNINLNTNTTTVVTKSWIAAKIFWWVWKRFIKIELRTEDGKLGFTITNTNNL